MVEKPSLSATFSHQNICRYRYICTLIGRLNVARMNVREFRRLWTRFWDTSPEATDLKTYKLILPTSDLKGRQCYFHVVGFDLIYPLAIESEQSAEKWTSWNRSKVGDLVNRGRSHANKFEMCSVLQYGEQVFSMNYHVSNFVYNRQMWPAKSE